MRGVEISVRQVVSHAGYLPPGDVRLRGEQVIGQGLDGLTDFQETDADGVEDQPIEQLAPLCGNGLRRSPRGCPRGARGRGNSQRDGFAFDPGTNLRLQVRRRHQVDREAVEDALELLQ